VPQSKIKDLVTTGITKSTTKAESHAKLIPNVYSMRGAGHDGIYPGFAKDNLTKYFYLHMPPHDNIHDIWKEIVEQHEWAVATVIGTDSWSLHCSVIVDRPTNSFIIETTISTTMVVDHIVTTTYRKE